VGEVRGLGCFWAVELVRSQETREMFVPFNASGADAAPMAEVTAACRARGLYPFAHFNRLHACPPLVVSDDDARTGLALLDEALAVADRYVRD
jgi:taurine--2-oxoglutarate transaminase